MKVFLAPILFLALFFSFAHGQSKYTLTGYVRDMETGEVLIGALVQADSVTKGVTTNAYGFFVVTVAQPRINLRVSHIGYAPYTEQVSIEPGRHLNIDMRPAGNQLAEVVVAATNKKDHVASAQMGILGFTMDEVKNFPVLFGERDILKTIQMLPGVAKGGEGSANFYVRGGAGDQNLILLDEATVYNASHLMGFFSTFNSDAIKDLALYKGGIPAQYGGRLSSVLDIRMLEGNNQKFRTEGGLGLIASRIKLEGPIVAGKSSFLLSGRRTYADMFLKLSGDEKVNKSKLYFYDLNAKANYRFNAKNALYISGYLGRDDLGYGKLFNFDWGNSTVSLRWNHVFNSQLFSNTTLMYSNFKYNVKVSNENVDFGIASKIENFNLKKDFTYFHRNNSSLHFGFNVLHQHIAPASIDAKENGGVNNLAITKRKGLDVAAYLSHEWKPMDYLSLIYGLRVTDFMVLGPGNFYQFDDTGDLTKTAKYGTAVVKHYVNLEPRLSASFIIHPQHSIKASFNRITQNLHQLTNSTSALPTDQYILTSLNVKPQLADQLSLGYFTDFSDKNYEFSLETFYKKMYNQIDFRNGADLQGNEFIEGDLLYGKGRAYGAEFFLRKTKGRFSGWISYTVGRSERQFKGINDGHWFNARQDRKHDVSVVASYNLNTNWTLGASFVYYTGNAVTFPSGKYNLNGKTIFYFTERNGYRMPDYHRLDLSLTYDPKPVQVNKRFHSSWSFSVYNAYHKKNAYLIDFREKKDNPNLTEAYQIALFGIIPSVTWNFKF
ncbi:TonB-dependent receptor [Sphingobacterium sp. Mn56C]|uniref:TonB-dependent receptor n=1 Tax=Sphingobacterium sp. Mn56C TaxID=3395261 RepID=UPI003BD5443F